MLNVIEYSIMKICH